MLDYVGIFTKGGVLVWALSFTALRGDPVNAFVQECLLEERGAAASWSFAPPQGGAAYTIKWRLNNALGLVLVAVYQQALSLPFVDDLLSAVDRAFARQYRPDGFEYGAFEAVYRRLEAAAERGAQKGAASGVGGGALTDEAPEEEEEEGGSAEEDGEGPGGGASGAEEEEKEIGKGRAGGESVSVPADASPLPAAGFDRSALRRRVASAGRKKGGAPPAPPASAPAPKKTGKAARVWEDAALSRAAAEALDFTEGGAEAEAARRALERVDLSVRSRVDVAEAASESEGEDEVEGEEIGSSQAPVSRGLLGSLVRDLGVRLVGARALSQEDLAPSLAALQRTLMERNVAQGIAASVCESVGASLRDKPLGALTRASAAARQAAREALTRVLAPRRSLDVLREARASREARSARGPGAAPYTIVFVGVNGVGKSTTLSKVAYWLLQHDLRVHLAACDTFRSGAVEQLQTHAARLGVPLFHRGYERDPAKVAREASAAAARAGDDVLLVDTAGRMQDNEPLMRALAGLLTLNKPDLVLFVGEALVGNDGVDQLVTFDRRLAELGVRGRGGKGAIDGIVLTKFDTIDDKVGAAVSMVYASGAPIMFVGCGQTYPDLKRLDVDAVVKALLK